VARIAGIDLGTTNSCVALLDRGAPTVIPSPEGERTTPSVVSFLPDDRVLVGIPARRQAVSHPQRTVFGTKRLIGRKVNAADVGRLARAAPFRIVAAPNGDAWVRIDDRDLAPPEIAAYILERMKHIAEASAGEPVTQAVITVPAYFNDAQRQATKDAARIAGLDVRRILNEPTAAALAYGVHRRNKRQRVAVVDLGGGTFDVSILRVEDGLFEVLAVAGNAALGGDDFDRRLVERLVADLARAGGSGVAADPVALGRLQEEAERAKKVLADESTATIRLPFIGRTEAGAPLHLDRTIERHELEALTADLVAMLAPPCAAALRDAGLTTAELDDVLLVGGMTRVPAVQREIERFFGRRPSKGAHPDEVVALGAAAHAGILTGELDDVVLLDVTPHSLGVRVGENSAVVIPRNTTVPAKARKLFATTRDSQTHVAIEVYQGDAKDIRENRYLGRFTLDGLPPGPAGSVRVELTFLVDVDGLVSFAARELSSGAASHFTLAPSGGLSHDELERIIENRRARAARGD
jgi:molecular chaperone DnaK